MKNLQTLSSFFMFLSAIYNILFSFTTFVKNCNTLWAKNLFQYNKNPSYVKNVLTISYILFYSRFDLCKVKLHRFHGLYSAELKDNFMRHPLATMKLSQYICITLWHAIRDCELRSQKQDSYWRVKLCLD